jgi:rod shape-determining protein MreD
MITREYLLLPANRAFIAFTLAAAFILNLFPWGRWIGVPDFLALVLVFWNVHQPRLVGLGIAFIFGLLMDIHNGALLGEHALAYSILSYGATSLHRRVPWFGTAGQMIHVLPLFLLAQVSTLIVRLAVGASMPGWWYFLESFICILLWPLAERMLLAPQRRAVARDVTRPL